MRILVVEDDRKIASFITRVRPARAPHAERGPSRLQNHDPGARVIDAGQATAAAVGHVLGTALRTALENEDGNVVYEVQIRTAAGQIHDVKVDAGTGAVLHVDATDDDGDGEEDDD